MLLSRRIVLPLILLAGSLWGQQNVRSLTILHSNDLHARLQPDSDQRGGFAYLASAIRRERAACDDCLLLHAGDMVQGTPVSTLFRGLPVYELANLLGFDAVTLGNHEFDYGWEWILKYRKAARFPIVTSNVVDARGRLLADGPYVIKKVNGIRVAIIGAVMASLVERYSTPKLLGPWRALPLIETLQKYVAEVRGKADLIVILGHLENPEQEEIFRRIPEATVLITGHDHGGLEHLQEVDGRVNVRVRSYGREFGRLDLQVDVPTGKLVSWKWKRIPVEVGEFTPAADVSAQVAHWENKVAEVVDVPIGEAKRTLNPREVRLLMERAMREEMGADFAYMNQGGVRDRLPEGKLLARHVWNIMPFDNLVVKGRFKGSQLPAVVTEGRTIDPDREYTLAVSDFTAVNQNQKGQLETTGLAFPETGPLLRDLMIDWIKKQKTVE